MAAPPTFRLDTLAVHLVARLEASRRAHLDAPEEARAAFDRVVTESAAALARECREVLGDDVQARLLEREAHETFLPRYTRMALAQNAIEARGYGFVKGDGIVARAVATVIALVVASVLARVVPGVAKEAVFVLAACTPLVPEIRLWWTRRAWSAQLQELADDLGRLQDAAEALPGEPVAVPESAARPAVVTPNPHAAVESAPARPREEARR